MTREEIEGMRSNAIASCTTIDTMRDFVVRACDVLVEDRILPAYYKVEDYLYSNGKDKPKVQNRFSNRVGFKNLHYSIMKLTRTS